MWSGPWLSFHLVRPLLISLQVILTLPFWQHVNILFSELLYILFLFLEKLSPTLHHTLYTWPLLASKSPLRSPPQRGLDSPPLKISLPDPLLLSFYSALVLLFLSLLEHKFWESIVITESKFWHKVDLDEYLLNEWMMGGWLNEASKQTKADAEDPAKNRISEIRIGSQWCPQSWQSWWETRHRDKAAGNTHRGLAS